MSPETRSNLETLKFRAREPGAMVARVDGVEILFVEHPVKGLAMMVSYVSPRTMTEFEVFFPHTPSLQQLATAIIGAVQQCRPSEATDLAPGV